MARRPRPTSASLPRTVVMALVGVAALVLGACSDGGEDDAVPTPGDTVFTEGDLSEVPLPSGAVPIGVLSEDEDVLSRTFGVEQSTPATVADEMAVALRTAGWDEVFPFEESGRQVYRGEFTKDGRRLEVALAPGAGMSDEGPTASSTEVDGTQISLVLYPGSEGSPTFTGAPSTVPTEDSETD